MNENYCEDIFNDILREPSLDSQSTSSTPELSSPPTEQQDTQFSWIWQHAQPTSVPHLQGCYFETKYWSCLYCDKVYQARSGPLKAVQHLERKHKIAGPVVVSRNSLLRCCGSLTDVDVGRIQYPK